MLQLQKCDLCGGNNFTQLYESYDKMHNIEGNYNLNKCINCGLIFINPQPVLNELMKHYPSEGYYSLKKDVDKSGFTKLLEMTYYEKKRTLLTPFKLIFSPFPRTLITVKQGRYLDVGCGRGDFLLFPKMEGMDCYGVELGDFDNEFAANNKLEIFHGNLKDADYPDNFFDVISLNHVYEHVDKPMETITELHRILKPGGKIVLATPQSKSLAHWLFGKNWVQLDTPRHLFIYNTKTLISYANKAGLKLNKVRYNSQPFQFLGSVYYFWSSIRGKRPELVKSNFVKNKVLFFMLLPLSHLVNFLKIGDQVELILQK